MTNVRNMVKKIFEKNYFEIENDDLKINRLLKNQSIN